MKKIYLPVIICFLTFISTRAQYFIGDMTLNGNVAIFTIQPVGEDITNSVTGLDFYIRWPEADGNTVTFTNIINHTTNFPGIDMYSVNDEVDWDNGFHNQHFGYTGGTTDALYLKDVSYEVFRVTLGGAIPSHLELVCDNTMYDPYFFNVSGNSGADLGPVGTDVSPFPGSVNVSGDFWIKSFNLVALPITLKSFSAKLSNCKAIVDWTTSEEINSKLFEVQQSADGNNFVTVATVPAAGSTTGDLSYSKTIELSSAVTYFRLKMVSMDDKDKYSQVAVVKTTDCPGLATPHIRVKENPISTNVLSLLVAPTRDESINVELLDLSGKTVVQYMKNINTSTKQVDFNLPANAQGIYIVRVHSALKMIYSQKVFVKR